FAPAAGLARGAQITVAAGVLGAAALAFTVAEVIDNGFDLRGGYYPADVACLDSVLGARQLQYGYSDYWNAKRTTELSQRGLRVVSVHQQLGNYNWINSRAWFRPAYDFAIIDENAREGYRLRVDLIKETNGEPAFVEHCGSLTILGYGSNRLLAKP
ncbi:MAG TPA: hypothetical protein VI759_07715, partial [Dehalococcoidia bacterium]|nr:hypothetical protein [Dehalococcoidia bacterium]